MSRTLTRPEQVLPATRLAVEAAIEAVGYQPNQMARNLRVKRTFSILVLVPSIANPFFAEIIRGIEKTASDHGFTVLLGDTAHSSEREDSYAAMLKSRRTDGIIQFSARMPAPLLADAEAGRLALVNACELIDGFTGATVSIDNYAAARDMAEHLLSLGRRRIALLTGPVASPLTRSRKAGAEAAILTADGAASLVAVETGDFSIRSGYEMAQAILPSEPDALFCFNDEMALGALRRFHELGVAVPEQVAVAGFDDIAMARFAIPPLTTIAQPSQRLGELAAKLLLSILRGEKDADQHIVLPAELVVRGSTASRAEESMDATG